MLTRDAAFCRLDEQGAEVFCAELRTTFGEQLLSRTGGYEHPDASSLVEDSAFDEHVHALSGRCRVDAMKGGELVRRRNLRLFWQHSLDDVVLDLLSDLHEDRSAVFDHWERPPLAWLVTTVV